MNTNNQKPTATSHFTMRAATSSDNNEKNKASAYNSIIMVP